MSRFEVAKLTLYGDDGRYPRLSFTLGQDLVTQYTVSDLTLLANSTDAVYNQPIHDEWEEIVFSRLQNLTIAGRKLIVFSAGKEAAAGHVRLYDDTSLKFRISLDRSIVSLPRDVQAQPIDLVVAYSHLVAHKEQPDLVRQVDSSSRITFNISNVSQPREAGFNVDKRLVQLECEIQQLKEHLSWYYTIEKAWIWLKGIADDILAPGKALDMFSSPKVQFKALSLLFFSNAIFINLSLSPVTKCYHRLYDETNC